MIPRNDVGDTNWGTYVLFGLICMPLVYLFIVSPGFRAFTIGAIAFLAFFGAIGGNG